MGGKQSKTQIIIKLAKKVFQAGQSLQGEIDVNFKFHKEIP